MGGSRSMEMRRENRVVLIEEKEIVFTTSVTFYFLFATKDLAR